MTLVGERTVPDLVISCRVFVRNPTLRADADEPLESWVGYGRPREAGAYRAGPRFLLCVSD